MRRWKRRIGYESTPGRILRNGLPRPGGCLVMILMWGGIAVMGAILVVYSVRSLITTSERWKSAHRETLSLQTERYSVVSVHRDFLSLVA